MTKEKLRKLFILLISIFTAFVVMFYFLAEDQLKYKNSIGNIIMPSGEYVTDEIGKDIKISQTFTNNIDRIEKLTVVFTKYYKENGGHVVIELVEDNTVLMRKRVNIEEIKDQRDYDIVFENPITNLKGKQLTLNVYPEEENDLGVALMINKDETSNGSFVVIGNKVVEGRLCFSVTGSDESLVDDYYWYTMIAVGMLLAILLFVSYRKYCYGNVNFIVSAILALYNYEFLISQLVLRDFKSKYKRSILGVFWSFLNPLLTMTVQFLVFSTFFKADTQNYPVYLLTGVVCFSFFNECTTMCLSSISGNARLITKVYIPKYIFPLARTISSSVNLGISLIPLFLACLILGVALKPQALLFFFFLGCLIVFSLGIGLFLSALMVYFRDIQFLWTVLTQIWMYATPIFYPAEIVPDKYRFILRLNPLYHFIGNARTCLMNGVSPEPRAYLFCMLFALISLAIGSYTFKKTQDNFALYL